MINMVQLYGQTKILDHSLVSMRREFPFDGKICPETESSSTVKAVRYYPNEIYASFLNDEESFELLNQTILNIENAISNQADADKAYTNFSNLLHTEMENKLKKISGQSKNTVKSIERRQRPFGPVIYRKSDIVYVKQKNDGYPASLLLLKNDSAKNII